MTELDRLRAWHERIVAANPGEAMSKVAIRENGAITGYAPCYLPCWMLCDERSEFLRAVDAYKAQIGGDKDALTSLHMVPGVPMRAQIEGIKPEAHGIMVGQRYRMDDPTNRNYGLVLTVSHVRNDIVRFSDPPTEGFGVTVEFFHKHWRLVT